MPRFIKIRGGLASLVVTAVFAFATHATADTVIGSWDTAAPEGWIDWNTGTLQDIAAPRFAFNGIGATVGTGALQFNLPASAYSQWASLKLQMGSNGVNEWRDEFLANTKLSFDLTLIASEMDPVPANDFANIGMTVNADGYGFYNMGAPESVTPFTGFNGTDSFNPQLLVGTQTTTWTWDIASVHDADPATPAAPRTPGDVALAPNWIEIIFETYSNGGVVYHIDNVRLFTPSLGGDFDDNNVVDDLDLSNKWRPGFGSTGQTNDSNGDADGDGDVDGGDYLIWQRNYGATLPTMVAASVPEPTTIAIALMAQGILLLRRRSQKGLANSTEFAGR